jgi:hypothetical protein
LRWSAGERIRNYGHWKQSYLLSEVMCLLVDIIASCPNQIRGSIIVGDAPGTRNLFLKKNLICSDPVLVYHVYLRYAASDWLANE